MPCGLRGVSQLAARILTTACRSIGLASKPSSSAAVLSHGNGLICKAAASGQQGAHVQTLRLELFWPAISLYMGDQSDMAI